MTPGTFVDDARASLATEDEATLRLRKLPPSEGILDVELQVAASRACNPSSESQTAETTCTPSARKAEQAQWLRDLHRDYPQAANRLTHALIAMPVVGSEFLGFRLRAELGRGGFARVYLAEQEDLAGRHVVVKVTPDLWGEANTLAQLKHPNIVPVYSVHQCEPFQVVCMPYLGWTTFQDLLRTVQGKSDLPVSGKALIDAFKKLPGDVTVSAADRTLRASSLARLSYVEAIVTLCVQLADGLAHAHEHGIVHHDLKPANILLTDEGVPMLLDFNVAEDTKRPAGAIAACVAGTLPYMAPEQLATMHGTPTPVDSRCDLFAFGVIMFEMLTGRYPFQYRHPELGMVIDDVMADRREAPPRLRNWNPAITPALEAIVRRCLEPDPARRYQTAKDLRDDLECQRTHRPLLHTAEPSRKERLHKWTRRHARLLTVSGVGAIAVVILSAVGMLSVVRGRQLDQLEKQEQARTQVRRERDLALASWQSFQDEMKTIRFLLYTRTNEPEQLANGVSRGMMFVEEYEVPKNPAWQASGRVRLLPESEQAQLKESMAELLLLLARALLVHGRDQVAGTQTRESLEKALVLNERAAACSADAAASPALWQQCSTLYERLGDSAKTQESLARAEQLPLRCAADHYWLASDHVAAGRLREALPLLQDATRLEPQNFWAWFVLANCWDRLSVDGEAKACYGTCIALQPSFPWAHFNRGLVLLRQQDYRSACTDFDTVIETRPDLTDAYLNRALARQGLQQYAQAEQDLTEALNRGGPTRLYFLRARIREKRGDKDGAQHDYAEGLRRPPVDEKSWVARGYYLLTRDPQAALADFDEALRRNPRSADALQNKAHVLAEKLGRNEEALAVLNQSLAYHPDSVKARGGRGVVYARLGQREPALRDAEETLRRDASPPRLYQIACVYALTSKNQPDDRLQAFQLLSSALRKGYGFNLLETDTDLDPIRNQPEFRRLVEAARALRPISPKRF